MFAGQTLTVTNLRTEETITVVNAGSVQARAKRDGSVERSRSWVTARFRTRSSEKSPPLVDGGIVVVTLDAEGDPESVTVRGNVVNLCDRLAPAP